MAYAIIRLGGKQFKVQEGDTFKLEAQESLSPEVLMYSDGKIVSVGLPIISDISVKLSKVEDKRDRKVVVARFKSKSRYRKVKGHRQPITVVKVESISTKARKQTDAKAEKPRAKKEAKA